MHLVLEVRVPVKLLEFADEMKTIDEKGPAGLKVAEAVADVDRLGAPLVPSAPR